MNTVIKIHRKYIDLVDGYTDREGTPLKYGDKIFVIGPKREIFKTHFLGMSKSGCSVMYLSQYTNYIDSTDSYYIIRYEWREDNHYSDRYTRFKKYLVEIQEQAKKELGIDLNA